VAAKKKRRKRRKRAKMVQPFLSKKMNMKFTSRSSWERAYYTYLDNEPNVLAFYVEHIKIPYVSNIRTKKIRKYIPDVLIEYADRKEIVEIKPKKYLTKAVNVKKFAAARNYCETLGITFNIITEVDLKQMNLL
jgi:hypothetical protein